MTREDLPFDMYDVVKLINGLVIRRESGNSIYVDCPFCSEARKGKLNINFDKDSFRCNRCGEHGGMLKLYAVFSGNTISLSRAYDDILTKLSIDISQKNSSGQDNKRPKRIQSTKKASPENIESVYSRILALLCLHKKHEAALEQRGLTKEQIMLSGFRSIPDYATVKNIENVLSYEGYNVAGVPGFYTDRYGNWALNLFSPLQGVVFPNRGIDGRINGLCVRLDIPFENNTKYLWVGSSTKENGISAGSPIGFIGNPYSEVVYLTEGWLKSIVSHYLSGKSFLGNQGANHVEELKKAVQTLKKNGTRIMPMAYDNDRFEKKEVYDGFIAAKKIVEDAGLQSPVLYWNSSKKGIDDFLLFQREKKATIMY